MRVCLDYGVRDPGPCEVCETADATTPHMACLAHLAARDVYRAHMHRVQCARSRRHVRAWRVMERARDNDTLLRALELACDGANRD